MNTDTVIFKDYSDVLTVKGVQKMLGISRHQVYHLIESGKIRGIKLGKSYKIPKVSVIGFFCWYQQYSGQQLSSCLLYNQIFTLRVMPPPVALR